MGIIILKNVVDQVKEIGCVLKEEIYEYGI